MKLTVVFLLALVAVAMAQKPYIPGNCIKTFVIPKNGTVDGKSPAVLPTVKFYTYHDCTTYTFIKKYPDTKLVVTPTLME